MRTGESSSKPWAQITADPTRGGTLIPWVLELGGLETGGSEGGCNPWAVLAMKKSRSKTRTSRTGPKKNNGARDGSE